MEVKTVKQYTGRLTLPNHTNINLEGADQGTLKETVQAILKGGCRFEPSGNAGAPVLLVYHPTWEQGKTPLGWIAGFDVPDNMSIGAAFLERQAA